MKIVSSYSQITLYANNSEDAYDVEDFPEWTDDLEEKVAFSSSAIFIATKDDSIISVSIQNFEPAGMINLGSYFLKTNLNMIVLSSPDCINAPEEVMIPTIKERTKISIFCDSPEDATKIVLVSDDIAIN